MKKEERDRQSAKKQPTISARERGPGPGRYALPPTIGYINHDITKPSSPAYSFHSRMSSAMVSVDSSPGPRYLVDSKVTRFGRMETRSCSMSGRGRGGENNGAQQGFQTPGPGAYSPEKAPPIHHGPPSYTMGSRTRYRSVDPVPAPNSYSLPSLLGGSAPNKPSTAGYSFSGRRQVGGPSVDLCARSPGPARYGSTDPDVYRRRQPSFSIQKRTRRPHSSSSSSSCAPGPGTYSPERFHAHLPRPPSFSLGVRHSEFVTPLVVDMVD
ncbi:outer dense fiber protein 3-like protein 2a [Pseudoliparis swirei]|uniref:outer dense fiber protein 3-like protein 2a n=1 Tax=Pseudoliparis swirei TaxID=2059687 RepID=UPI0024BEEFD7|nr:outer dense fiber protein 3-like protein 2a [Pseudoliparis swirei]